MYCKNCGNEIDPNAAICVKCGFQKGQGEKYCHNCGKETSPGAAVCMNCGFAQKTEMAMPVDGAQKSKLTAALLAFFLGGIGIHNFYLGNKKFGILHIVVFVIGGILCAGIGIIASWIWAVVEGILCLTGNTKTDANGIPLK